MTDARRMEHGARDLVTFPWESDEAAREKGISYDERARFEQFMAEGAKKFKKE